MLRGYDFRSRQHYSPIQNGDMESEDVDEEINETKPQTLDVQQKARQSFHRIWTSTVLTTLSAQAIFDFHMG
jgi:hypothetical protein